MCIFIFIGFDVTGTGIKWKSLFGILSFVFGSVALIGVGTVVTLAQPFNLLVSSIDIFDGNKFSNLTGYELKGHSTLSRVFQLF